MSTAEIRAHHIFNTYRLMDEDEEVKRNLMVLLLTTHAQQKNTCSYEEAFNSLEGAWENDGMVAEEEVDSIYAARQNGKTRKIINL